MSPSVSPDGRWVAYLGRRDVFTLDLYLADAETGEVVKELASSATDAHFDAIQFMNSSGTWSPDGRQFAFVVVYNGDNSVVIINVESQDIVRKIELKELAAVSHLSWSPDGSRLALSANAGGINDLYLYDLDTSELQAVTNDRYAQLQPTWSPDGAKIAYMTEQGEPTSLENLHFRKMQIAVLDLHTRDLRLVAISTDTRHTNPAFGNDGASLYMIADPRGYADIYRFDLADDTFTPITNIATGISGLTSLSPAMSIASKSGLMVCSVFDNAGYQLRVLSPESLTASSPVTTSEDESTTRALTVDRFTPTVVTEFLNEPTSGLADTAAFSSRDYNPSLSLIYAGQSTIGVAVDRFGSSLSGGASFLFSDMLGNRELGITAIANGGFADIGGQVYYRNLRNRWNWGVTGGHIPYLTGRVITSIDTVAVNGDSAEVRRQDLIRERVFVERAAGLAEYPLSKNRRFEFSAGFSHISYDTERETIFAAGGVILGTEEEDIASPSSLNLGQVSVAYVGDYSFFGFTSPARGSRYRFEAEPTFGSLQFVTFLADYRKYFFANPVTFAFRGWHHGRYLGDSDSDRLSPLYLGFQTFVRGYSVGSIDLADCTDDPQGGGCPEYDRLVGNRLAVFNAEIRLPLLGSSRYGLVNWPYLPTELTAFFDAGAAWSSGQPVELKLKERSTERIPVFSAGAALRINFFGYLVGQFYYAFPFQRPETTGQFGFVIAPGW